MDKYVLVACEESQRVCISFRKRGFIAYSCDIQDCSGGYPGWHIKGDCLRLLDENITFNTCDGKTHFVPKWDLLIAFPPCTYLTNAGNQCFSEKKKSAAYIQERKFLRENALLFVRQLYHCSIKRVCIENPCGYLNSHFMVPSQVIHPFYFCNDLSDDFQKKRTCLWLKGLPPLLWLPYTCEPLPISIDNGGVTPGKKRYFVDNTRNAVERSKTFLCVANAMAEQWGVLL